MSLKDVPVGSYNAKCVGGMFDKIGARGTPAVVLGFEFEHNGAIEKIRGTFYLSDTACSNGLTVFENTFDTLVGKLGWNEEKPLLTLPDGKQWFDKSFLADKEVQIVIELSQDGKYKNVAWVNELGGGRLAGLAVHQVLPGANIKAAAAAARARMGVKKPSAPQPQPHFTADENPF